MTGFSRVEGRVDGFGWVWELRSVNGKSFDPRFKLPAGFDALEAPLKLRLGEAVKRGSLMAALTVSDADSVPLPRINQAALDQVVALIRSLEGVVDAAPPRLDGLLGLRGVMELAEAAPSPEARAMRLDAVSAGFDVALAALLDARMAEGARIAQVLGERLDEIGAHIADAERSAAAQPAAIRQRFQTQLDALLAGAPPISEDRLAQEFALLIAKADVREELDRLSAHVAAARDLLAEGQGIGRRLDFLCQEFNREANTICSKSADLGLTRTGLGLKAAIEQLREQVQNIE